KPGVCTILRGMRISILSGMLWGKQCADGRSAMKLAIRFWWSASAAGSNGGIFSPGRIKSSRFGPIARTVTRSLGFLTRSHRPETLDDVECFALGMTDFRVQPILVIEADGVYFQHVTLPPADSVAQPAGLWIHRKRPPVSEYLPEGGIPGRLVKKDNNAWSLDDLERSNGVDPRHARGHAPRQRIVFVLSFLTLTGERLRPRLERNLRLLMVRIEVKKVRQVVSLPDPGKVGFSV